MSNHDASSDHVWLDMDQTALDRAYDQTQFAPNMQSVLKRYELASGRTRARLGEPSRHRYGADHRPGGVEALDCFIPKGAGGLVPAVLFIHGGAWRSGLARDYAFVADALVDTGCAALIADFSPVTDLDGDLGLMADQIRRAIAWLARQAPELGIDPQRIHLVGHSSGAHLAALAACTDWGAACGLLSSPIASLTVCSGIYDLEPVSRSARSRYVRLDAASVAALSPIRHRARLAIPVTVAWGGLESPEFQRQAREFAEQAEASGVSVERVVAPASNHFEILESIATPHGLLGEALLAKVRTVLPAARSTSAERESDPDLYWMRFALEASQQAYDRGDWPTGAVLVRDGQLLATGQNRQVTLGDFTVHAETDAIRRALASGGPLATQGATLYCTMEPCPMCAGALKLAGVTRIVLALRHATLRRTDLGDYAMEPFFEMTNWTPELRSGVLENDYASLRKRWGRDPVRTD